MTNNPSEFISLFFETFGRPVFTIFVIFMTVTALRAIYRLISFGGYSIKESPPDESKEDFPEDAIMCPPLEKKCDDCLCLNCDQFQFFCKPCERCHGENVRPIFSCGDCKKICKKGIDK